MKSLLPVCCLALCLAPALPALAQTGPARIYERVEVRGAALVPPEDIRKTCGDPEGVPLDSIDLTAIENCLLSTGVFESVSVHSEAEVLVIEVQEPDTGPGRVDVGLAWATDLGLNGSLAYEQINLIPGTYLSLRGTYSRDYHSYALNLLGREDFSPQLRFGFDLEGERARHDDLDFSGSRDLVEGWLRWSPQENLGFEAGIGYRRQAVFDVKPGASPLLALEVGQVAAPFLHVAFDFQTPRNAEGLQASLRIDQYLWNLGTTNLLAETRLDAQARLPLSEHNALLFGLRGGLVAGLGGAQVTVADRLFPGGENFRGFAPRGIGPVHMGSHLGANRYLIGSFEVQRDLTRSEGHRLRGGAFVDIGAVWGLDNTLGGAIDAGGPGRLRSSVGLSVSFDLGGMPVSLFVATPLKSYAGDRRQVFGLSAAARF